MENSICFRLRDPRHVASEAGAILARNSTPTELYAEILKPLFAQRVIR